MLRLEFMEAASDAARVIECKHQDLVYMYDTIP